MVFILEVFEFKIKLRIEIKFDLYRVSYSNQPKPHNLVSGYHHSNDSNNDHVLIKKKRIKIKKAESNNHNKHKRKRPGEKEERDVQANEPHSIPFQIYFLLFGTENRI